MLAERLKQLRSQKNITQSTLANSIGIGKTTLAAYEQGKSEPNNNTLVKIAEYFNVTTDYLLGISPCKSDENDAIFKKIGLSDKSIENLEKINALSHTQLTIWGIDSFNRNPIGALDFILSQDDSYQFISALYCYFSLYLDSDKHLYVDDNEINLSDNIPSSTSLVLSLEYLPQTILLEIESYLKAYRQKYSTHTTE